MNLPDLWVVLDIGTTELKGALTNSQGEIEKNPLEQIKQSILCQVLKSKMLRNGGTGM